MNYIATIFLFKYYIDDSHKSSTQDVSYYAKGKKQWQILNLQKKEY